MNEQPETTQYPQLNLRRERVLSAVQAMGAATTLDVAGRCGLGTYETLDELRALEAEQRLQAVGRRWIAPSRSLRHVDLNQPKNYGCWIVLALVFGLGLSLWMGLSQ